MSNLKDNFDDVYVSWVKWLAVGILCGVLITLHYHNPKREYKKHHQETK